MQFYNPWTAFIDPFINILPLGFTFLDFLMNNIYLDVTYITYPPVVTVAFLIANYFYTTFSGNAYIALFTYLDGRTYFYEIVLIGMTILAYYLMYLVGTQKV